MVDNRLVLKPGKEYIVTRLARKLHRCHECDKVIEKGEKYIEDHINYLVPRIGQKPYKKWVINRICLESWKGPIP